MRISDWSSDVCSSDLRRRSCHYAALLENTGCRDPSRSLATHAREAALLRHRPGLSPARRPGRLCDRRSRCLGHARHPPVDLRSRYRHRLPSQAPSGRRLNSVTRLASSRFADRTQLDLFRSVPGDVAARDAQDLMTWPFFSLAKSSPVTPLDFHMGPTWISEIGRASGREGVGRVGLSYEV